MDGGTHPTILSFLTQASCFHYGLTTNSQHSPAPAHPFKLLGALKSNLRKFILHPMLLLKFNLNIHTDRWAKMQGLRLITVAILLSLMHSEPSRLPLSISTLH